MRRRQRNWESLIIGKTVEEQLVQVGISSADELRRVGAKAAWLKQLFIIGRGQYGIDF